MAENDQVRAMEIFWTRDEKSDPEDDLVFVPGIQSSGNRRPAKVKGRKTKEVKAKIPSKQPVVQDLQPENTNQQEDTGKQTMKTKHHQRKASLKDLCTEDKRRVASLVHELARVGEERESAVQNLHAERVKFETQIGDLLHQQNNILTQREVVQQQLFECQSLLTRYQQCILEQQERLSDALSDHMPRIIRDTQKPTEEFHLSPRVENYDNVKTSRKRRDTPTRSEYEQELDKENYMATPKQHTNLKTGPVVNKKEEVKSPSGTSSRASTSRDRTPVQSKNSTPEHRKYVLPSSPASRPFTNKIDDLIANESDQHPESDKHHFNINSSNDKTKKICTDQGFDGASSLPKDRLYGLGPLAAPVLSSTQRTEYEREQVNRYQMRNGQHSANFQPLEPDSRSRSSTWSGYSQGTSTNITNVNKDPQLQEHVTATDYGNKAQIGGTVTGYGSRAQIGGAVTDYNTKAQREGAVTFGSPVMKRLTQQSDEEFLQQYQKLTPEERRKELLAQKEALLLEQRKLRQILEEQEILLQTKQEQLHNQQEQQRQRLQFFEQQGYFPYTENAKVNSSPPRPGLSNNIGNLHTGTATQVHLPDLPQYERPDGLLDQKILDAAVGDQETNLPKTNGALGSVETNGDLQYTKLLQGIHNQLDEMSDSMENLRFLERHGIDISPMKKSENKPASTVTSPRQMTGSYRHPTSLVRSPRTRPQHTVQTQYGYPDSMINTSSYRPPQTFSSGSNNGSMLADLVDEVESIQNQSRGSGSGQRRSAGQPGPSPGRRGVVEDEDGGEEEDEDLEESKLLEDVFFVK